jgi:nucleotide-binding universal stress UspA family protein
MASTSRTVRRTRRSRRRPATRPAQRHRLIVATTGEPESRGALRFAASLGERFPSAAVLAVGVAAPFPHNVSTMLSLKQPTTIDDESRRDLLDIVRRTVAEIPGADGWEKLAITGAPSDEINEIAERWGATMLVLGLGRHNRIDRIFGSETAIAVMRNARIPVVAVPAAARGMPERALVAMDFTAASTAAANLAAQLVPQHGVLYVVHVCAFAGATAEPGDLIDLYRAGARAKLDEVVATIRRYGDCAIESALLEGEPADAILKFAKRERVSLIALGGHEQGLVDRILLGSIRTKVLRGATCPVLIAPPSA